MYNNIGVKWLYIYSENLMLYFLSISSTYILYGINWRPETVCRVYRMYFLYMNNLWIKNFSEIINSWLKLKNNPIKKYNFKIKKVNLKALDYVRVLDTFLHINSTFYITMYDVEYVEDIKRKFTFNLYNLSNNLYK